MMRINKGLSMEYYQCTYLYVKKLVQLENKREKILYSPLMSNGYSELPFIVLHSLFSVRCFCSFFVYSFWIVRFVNMHIYAFINILCIWCAAVLSSFLYGSCFRICSAYWTNRFIINWIYFFKLYSLTYLPLIFPP